MTGGTWRDYLCSSKNRPGSYARYYTFTMSRAAELSITLESPEDAYLFLLEGIGRSGRVLYEYDDHDGDVFTLASEYDSGSTETLQAGTYTIEATTYDPATTGSFWLTVAGIPPAPVGPERPDLVVESLVIDKTAVDVGEVFTLTATVLNQGDGPSRQSGLHFSESADSSISSDNRPVASHEIGPLAPGESVVRSSSHQESSSGTLYCIACVSILREESDEGNNCSEGVPVTVRSSTGPMPPSTFDCSNGVAVPNPDSNTGLVSDCEALLEARDKFTKSDSLNWSVDTPIQNWAGFLAWKAFSQITIAPVSRCRLNWAIYRSLSIFTSGTMIISLGRFHQS